MKKKISLISLLVGIVFLVGGSIILSSCEGPAGADGADGNVTCMECHSEDAIQIITEQFAQSVHRAGQIAVDYAGSRSSCAQCHSSEGFIEFARTGDVAENITAPSAWECKTCHNIHTTFNKEDYALRLATPVAMIFDESVIIDLGNSNLCANCHQSRRSGPTDMGGEMVDLDDDDIDETEVPAGHFFISSTHYGPHHGAQANVLYGAGFPEISGSKSYPAAGTGAHIGAGCTSCHMGEYAEGVGGHSWNPVYCGECHTSGSDDYEFMGVMEDNEAKLLTLRGLLADAGVIEYVEEDKAWEPIVGIYPVVQAEAFFNWIGLEEDRSMGVHNPAYVEALLDNTIAAMQAK